MRPKGISIGDFNLRVTFYSVTEGARDSMGELTPSVSTGVDRWANVKYKNMPYSVNEGGLEFQEAFEISIRRDSTLSLTQGDRVSFDGQDLQVMNINHVDLVTTKILAQAIA